MFCNSKSLTVGCRCHLLSVRELVSRNFVVYFSLVRCFDPRAPSVYVVLLWPSRDRIEVVAHSGENPPGFIIYSYIIVPLGQ